MKRGFEHRLWGYKVVKIKQPDAERGTVSRSASSARSPSPTAIHNNDESGEYGNLGTVEFPVESDSAQHDKDLDQETRECSNFENVESTIRPVVSEYRRRSEEIEEREGAGEWQIPETVILTSESISPF